MNQQMQGEIFKQSCVKMDSGYFLSEVPHTRRDDGMAYEKLQIDDGVEIESPQDRDLQRHDACRAMVTRAQCSRVQSTHKKKQRHAHILTVKLQFHRICGMLNCVPLNVRKIALMRSVGMY